MASQFLPLGQIPPGTQLIMRSVQAAGTIYTPATGRVFHMMACWVSVQGSTTAGNANVNARPRADSTLRILLSALVGVHAAGDGEANNSLFLGDYPCEPNVAITLTSNALTGATVFGGIVGWEEAQSQ